MSIPRRRNGFQAGRKAFFSNALEGEELVEWIETSRRQHRVTCNTIQWKAAAIYDTHCLGECKSLLVVHSQQAVDGWRSY